jgi:presequence protease
MKHEHGFVLQSVSRIAELDTDASLYEHEATGARLLSLVNEDANKVFGISFRTPPEDSTGVAHILEHSVLCGSEKYPLKDPFVQLLKGSLQTFLNALTFPDKTVYPVASQNLRDFYNLIDVYLDAVLFPLISRETFLQEGWHYDLRDPDGPLAIQGVVYNEMKGVYSSPDSLSLERSQQSLFPDTMYGLDSGGDPSVIPTLTYEKFRAFHQDHYNPSNALAFFCGNDPPEERFRILHRAFQRFERRPPAPAVRAPAVFEAPRVLQSDYAIGPDEPADGRSIVTLNWLLSDSAEPFETMALHVLAHMLVETPASPLRKALLDSGLGEDLAGAGLESELRQIYFSTGLRNVRRDGAEDVERIALETLQSLAGDGIDPRLMEAALNTLEFHLRENNTGSLPRGLALMFRALVPWLHGSDPVAMLAFEEPLRQLKDEWRREPRAMERRLKRWFLDNPHRTRVELHPRHGLEEARRAEEKASLQRALQRMDADRRRELMEQTSHLIELQSRPDSPAAVASLPLLERSEINREEPPVPEALRRAAGCDLLLHELRTNGVLYVDIGFDLAPLSGEERALLPLLGRAFLEAGTARTDYVSLAHRIGSRTGGIYPSLLFGCGPDAVTPASAFHLRGKCTRDQVGEMLNLFEEMLNEVNLADAERLLQIMREEKAGIESGLIPSGHQFVRTRLESRFHDAGRALEAAEGLDQLARLKRWIARAESDFDAWAETIRRAREALVDRGRMHLNATGDADLLDRAGPDLETFPRRFPNRVAAGRIWEAPGGPRHEALSTSSRVNYVGMGLRLGTVEAPVRGADLAVARYLRTAWLWEQVRVLGGAYGAFCTLDRRTGVLQFGSYRDPHIDRTLDVYRRTPEFLRTCPLDESEVRRAIIGAIGALDTYRFPDALGYRSLTRRLLGVNPEEVQRVRDEIIGTETRDFRAFADRLEQAADGAWTVILADDAAIRSSRYAADCAPTVTPVAREA